MKKLYIFLLFIFSVFILLNTEKAEAQSGEATTFILSNESPGCLIDTLIAYGYGSATFYDVLLHLQGSSGGIIYDAFMDTLAHNPSGSETFTKKLSDYAGLTGSLAINSDGTVKTVSIFGKNYYQLSGYKTYPNIYYGSGRELFTYATSPEYYLDAGTGIGGKQYKAFAIAWSMESAPTTFVLSNEGGLIDSLIAAGFGNSSIFETIASLQGASGDIISDEFLEILAGNPPGSEIFTKKLSEFAGLDSAIAINTDGTYKLVSIKGKNYYKKAGYATYPETTTGTGRELFTYATSPEYYIDAGTGTGGKQYKAFAIAWSMESAPTTFVLSNEGGLIDSLIADGYGNGSLYYALLNIQGASGGVISNEFLMTLASNPDGSEIYKRKLSEYAGLDSAVAINTDGTYKLISIKGKEYYTKEGYATYPDTSTGYGGQLFTYATSPEYYIDAGTGTGGKQYKAFAIAWSDAGTDVPEVPGDEISIYPNPFSEGIYIPNIEYPAEIEIYDILGSNVYSSNIEGDRFIPLPSLQDGIYWVKLSIGKNVYQQVLVRN